MHAPSAPSPQPPAPSLQERRASARAWLRLSPEQRALIPRPRVYRNDARDDRSYANIARAMGVHYAH